ncbi:hypothetical protein WJX72_003916 [[Myrmecia] bisecta]|uniref:Trimethylguanosine synthase n=1 Tax=[Myrmecia] bisecta TaxID=41462 RepID=A0AAW1PS31_9CHLO
MVAIHTPIDLPLDDLQDHQLDRCLLTTSSLTDVGIVGVAGAWQRSGEADEAEQDSALQLDPAEAAALEQLGLPTAFGSSKDTTASKPQRKKSSQTPKVEQAALQLPDVFEAEEPAQQRFEKAATAAGLSGATATPSTSEWEQGYDYETGYYYYYRVSTNETQWETPAEGFRPLCFPGMEAGTRYSLFSRFDEGIQMDQEGWFSVTPEVMAAACAARCAGAVVVDAFAGVGGNTIQFAAACRHVIAVDVCQARLELAQHNAGVYGVVQKADFVCADFFRIAPSLKADIVFLSPPWGGPSYGDSSVFDITGDPFGLGVTLKELTDVSWKALHPNSKARGLICFLPRNTNLQQLCEVVPEGMYCEVERNLLNGYLKATTVYIGNCFRRE